jgi:TELO2-interacting protein 1
MEARNELFKQLKPSCIKLAQAAASAQSSKIDQEAIVEDLEAINRILRKAAGKETGVLDAKLTDYVFFPIAQLLRSSKALTIRSLELCIQVIATLVDQGWKDDIQPPLAMQLIFLCSSLGEQRPNGFSFVESTSELQSWSFWSLRHLFLVVAPGSPTARLLLEEVNVPQIGQTLSVILDGIQQSDSTEVQVAAASSLEALIRNVLDREMQARFLPGIVSSLTKVLTPQSKQRRNHAVLISCLNSLRILLHRTLKDTVAEKSGTNGTNGRSPKSIIDADWQEQAASRLKPALTNVFRLMDAVAKLCIELLRDCRQTLTNSSNLALETLITIAADQRSTYALTQTQELVYADSSIATLLRTMLYDWVQALPTVMQGSDPEIKAAKTQQIITADNILTNSEPEADSVKRSMTMALRDSAVVLLALSKPEQQPIASISPLQSFQLQVADSRTTTFGTPFTMSGAQRHDFGLLEIMTPLLGSNGLSLRSARELARELRHSTGNTQLATFWLLLATTRSATETTGGIDDLLNLDENSNTRNYDDILEEIYSFSLSVLTDSAEHTEDSKLRSLALRGVALRAQAAGEDFRYELVDALYPVLHTLATPAPQLQQDSIITLNIFASACGYPSVQNLVVENVDYLVNAVALKLNAFDVSPQAPQVLLMMVRLAGPSLLPYLEDTVESIFAALEDYHGYPILVELLFKVLTGIAEEGVKAPRLALLSLDSRPGHIRDWTATTVHGLVALLQQRTSEAQESTAHESDADSDHPRTPWKADEHDIKPSGGVAEIEQHLEEGADVDMSDPPPPAAKAYDLLFKITDLTQHFLPAASASLRTSLLALIRTTVPVIALHENTFLPLINTLWPEVVARLDDEEPYNVAAALEVVGVLCQYAGDFMRTRIIEVWPHLIEMQVHTFENSHRGRRSTNALYDVHATQQGTPIGSASILKPEASTLSSARGGMLHTHEALVDEALTRAVTAILHHVQLPPELVDDAFSMLRTKLHIPAVRTALEHTNSDALYLLDIEAGNVEIPHLPTVPTGATWCFAQLSGVKT